MEKQKTCITIVKNVDISNSFTEFININHPVDIINVTSIGFLMVDNIPSYPDEVYYVVSNLVQNNHDTILSVAGNVTVKYNASKIKTFNVINRTIYGTYNFDIYDLATLSKNTNTSGSVHIDLEFIELQK